VPVVLNIQDENDNKPLFTQDTYVINVKQLTNSNSSQHLIKYHIQDKDAGVYGVSGLFCSLLGQGYEK
jgi:hypothetical protein